MQSLFISGVSIHSVPISQLRSGTLKDMCKQHLRVIPKNCGRNKELGGGMMCHSMYLQSERRVSTSAYKILIYLCRALCGYFYIFLWITGCWSEVVPYLRCRPNNSIVVSEVFHFCFSFSNFSLVFKILYTCI